MMVFVLSISEDASKRNLPYALGGGWLLFHAGPKTLSCGGLEVKIMKVYAHQAKHTNMASLF